MYDFNLSPLEDISTDWLRSHLRQALDEVRFHEARYCVLRRGKPMAGIVPIAEARALYEACRVDRKYRDVHLQQQIDREDRLRVAIHAQAEREGPDFDAYRR